MTADLSNGTDAAISRCGDIEIDRERHLVTGANRRLDLTFMEFNILVAITEQAGKVVAYDDLTRRFWGTPTPSHRRRLSVLVSRLRAKLGVRARYIDTVHRVGYRLTPP